MNSTGLRTMRNALIEQIYSRMHDNDRIFFVSADMGAPALDKLREDFEDRFLNVGIAEQNLINVSTGLAIEGFTVFAYAISGFLTMRAYEQIRTNLALSSQQRQINVNLIGVGSGVSYDMSGPSHHCMEDLAIMRVLPNIVLFSPSDWLMTEEFVDFTINVKCPKYIRLDGKPLPQIYKKDTTFEWRNGFYELAKGDDICIVSTGYMTHKAIKIAKELEGKTQIGVVDVFLLKPINERDLYGILKDYKCVITLEEAFVNKGGLDSLVLNMLSHQGAHIELKSFGFDDKYFFQSGNREFLYELNNCSEQDIVKTIKEMAGRLGN